MQYINIAWRFVLNYGTQSFKISAFQTTSGICVQGWNNSIIKHWYQTRHVHISLSRAITLARLPRTRFWQLIYVCHVSSQRRLRGRICSLPAAPRPPPLPFKLHNTEQTLIIEQAKDTTDRRLRKNMATKINNTKSSRLWGFGHFPLYIFGYATKELNSANCASCGRVEGGA